MKTFEWPEWMRAGPMKEGTFRSHLHQERIGAWLGLALGVAFGVCFLTGLLSHLIQHPPGWFQWPSRPAGLYRITQGLHVATGIAAIPLLLAKLWVVYPHFWTWPPVRTIAHAVERISLFALIAGALFMLVSGLANVANWYPWAFFFPRAHYWMAWITVGALVVHIAAKLPITRDALKRRREELPEGEGLSRRAFLTTVAASVVGVTIATAGQTFRPLRGLSVLAPRDPIVGPQGLPVNKSARSANVLRTARDPAYRLRVVGNVAEPLELSLRDLRAMPQREAALPISCVEGWSAGARWRGVRVRDLLDRAGAPADAFVTVESLQPRGLYRQSELNASHASDPDTLLALEVNGEELHIDHGYPLRLIGPNRPGVMQTKWVSKLTIH